MLLSLKKSNAIPLNKRRELLNGLGYDWHPALTDGRLNNPLPNSSGKPRLFILDGHAAVNLPASDVPAAYTAAQRTAQVMPAITGGVDHGAKA